MDEILTQLHMRLENMVTTLRDIEAHRSKKHNITDSLKEISNLLTHHLEPPLINQGDSKHTQISINTTPSIISEIVSNYFDDKSLINNNVKSKYQDNTPSEISKILSKYCDVPPLETNKVKCCEESIVSIQNELESACTSTQVTQYYDARSYRTTTVSKSEPTFSDKNPFKNEPIICESKITKNSNPFISNENENSIEVAIKELVNVLESKLNIHNNENNRRYKSLYRILQKLHLRSSNLEVTKEPIEYYFKNFSDSLTHLSSSISNISQNKSVDTLKKTEFDNKSMEKNIQKLFNVLSLYFEDRKKSQLNTNLKSINGFEVIPSQCSKPPMSLTNISTYTNEDTSSDVDFPKDPETYIKTLTDLLEAYITANIKLNSKHTKLNTLSSCQRLYDLIVQVQNKTMIFENDQLKSLSEFSLKRLSNLLEIHLNYPKSKSRFRRLRHKFKHERSLPHTSSDSISIPVKDKRNDAKIETIAEKLSNIFKSSMVIMNVQINNDEAYRKKLQSPKQSNKIDVILSDSPIGMTRKSLVAKEYDSSFSSSTESIQVPVVTGKKYNKFIKLSNFFTSTAFNPKQSIIAKDACNRMENKLLVIGYTTNEINTDRFYNKNREDNLTPIKSLVAEEYDSIASSESSIEVPPIDAVKLKKLSNYMFGNLKSKTKLIAAKLKKKFSKVNNVELEPPDKVESIKNVLSYHQNTSDETDFLVSDLHTIAMLNADVIDLPKDAKVTEPCLIALSDIKVIQRHSSSDATPSDLTIEENSSISTVIQCPSDQQPSPKMNEPKPNLPTSLILEKLHDIILKKKAYNEVVPDKIIDRRAYNYFLQSIPASMEITIHKPDITEDEKLYDLLLTNRSELNITAKQTEIIEIDKSTKKLKKKLELAATSITAIAMKLSNVLTKNPEEMNTTIQNKLDTLLQLLKTQQNLVKNTSDINESMINRLSGLLEVHMKRDEIASNGIAPNQACTIVANATTSKGRNVKTVIDEVKKKSYKSKKIKIHNDPKHRKPAMDESVDDLVNSLYEMIVKYVSTNKANAHKLIILEKKHRRKNKSKK